MQRLPSEPAPKIGPSALLFDLGNVCLPFDHGRMVAQLADLFAVPPAAVSEAMLDSRMLSDIECGRVSDDELHAALCERFGRRVAAADLFQAASDIFTPDPEMERLLATLAGGPRPLVLVSNTSRPHIDFVRREYDLLSHFDRLVLSFEVGAAKPDRAFFDAAFEAAGVPPHECFYTDDIPEYVSAAAGLGVDAVRFRSATQIAAELRDRGVLQ